MKFGDILESTLTKMQKNFRQKISTGKVLFGGFCGIIESACHYYVNYPENETLPLGDPVPPKASILEVWVLLMSKKILVKKF